MAMHNDVSFLIDLRLNLYEHQSTHNPNLPSKFIVFYNGEEERLERVRKYTKEMTIARAVESRI